MVYWANNLAFKIALHVYLSNIHSKRSVNMNFHQGLCCLRRKGFFSHPVSSFKWSSLFHILILLEIKVKRILTKENIEQEVLSTEQGEGLGLLCLCSLILNRAALKGVHKVGETRREQT